jgi:hypothetical protein
VERRVVILRKTLTTPLLLQITIWTRRFDAPSCSASVHTGSNPSHLPSHLPMSCHTKIRTSSACMCFCKLHGCLYIGHTSQDLGRRRPLQSRTNLFFLWDPSISSRFRSHLSEVLVSFFFHTKFIFTNFSSCGLDKSTSGSLSSPLLRFFFSYQSLSMRDLGVLRGLIVASLWLELTQGLFPFSLLFYCKRRCG